MQPSQALVQVLLSNSLGAHRLDPSRSLPELAQDKREVAHQGKFQRLMRREVANKSCRLLRLRNGYWSFRLLLVINLCRAEMSVYRLANHNSRSITVSKHVVETPILGRDRLTRLALQAAHLLLLELALLLALRVVLVAFLLTPR